MVEVLSKMIKHAKNAFVHGDLQEDNYVVFHSMIVYLNILFFQIDP